MSPFGFNLKEEFKQMNETELSEISMHLINLGTFLQKKDIEVGDLRKAIVSLDNVIIRLRKYYLERI